MVSDDLITWYQLNNILTGDYSLRNREFVITFIISIISAVLGLVKCLKNGVARPIGEGGCLDGLLSVRTALAFFASGITLMCRGLCLGFVVWVINILLFTLESGLKYLQVWELGNFCDI